LEITLISLCSSGVPHTIQKLLMRLQLCFRPHFIQRFAHKIMGLQSGGSPKFKEFWDSQLGSPALKKEERQKKLQAIKCKAKKNIDFVTFFLHYAPKIIIFKRSPANFGKSKK
jgi:hypothetical protein